MINPRGSGDGGGGGAAARQQGYDPTLVGKRTGVTVPPRGQVTFDSPSSGGKDGLFENPDAFFAAARSGGKNNKSVSLAGGRDDNDGDDNGRRMSPRGKKGGRQGVVREEFEEETRRNAARRPDMLQSDEDEYDEQEDGKARSKVSSIASVLQNNMVAMYFIRLCFDRRMLISIISHSRYSLLIFSATFRIVRRRHTNALQSHQEIILGCSIGPWASRLRVLITMTIRRRLQS